MLDELLAFQSISELDGDNGPMEGFWDRLKCEMDYLNAFHSKKELIADINIYNSIIMKDFKKN